MIVSYFKFEDLEFADSATLSNVSTTDLIVDVFSCILYTILNDVKFLYSDGDYYIENGYLIHGTSYTYFDSYGIDNGICTDFSNLLTMISPEDGIEPGFYSYDNTIFSVMSYI